eukprot:gene8352-biopygen1980
MLTTLHVRPSVYMQSIMPLSIWLETEPLLQVYLRRLSYHFTRDSRFASNACDAVSESRVWILNPMSEAATAAENGETFFYHGSVGTPYKGCPTHPTSRPTWDPKAFTAPIDFMMDLLRYFPHLRRETPFAMSAIRFSHTNWAYVYVILLMHMVEHGFSLDEYKYEVNRDGSLYSGCADTLYRELDGVENWTSIHTWGKEQGLPIRVSISKQKPGTLIAPTACPQDIPSLHLTHYLTVPRGAIYPAPDASLRVLPTTRVNPPARAQEEIHLLAADRDMARYHQNPAKPQQQLTPGTLYGEDVNPVNVYDLLPMPEPLHAETHPTRPPLSFEPSNRFFTVEEEERCCNQTRCTRLCGTPDISIHPSSIFVITPSALHQALPDIQPQYPDDWGNNNNSDEEVSMEPETTDTDEAEDGRLQSLASCLNHMDPNFLQEGGINNSMPDGAVTPNPDRGAIHPDCDLFIGHHRDGTEAERSEMAAMLNKYTAAVARTMEDLREGYKGCVPPLDIKKDNDKQAFTSPYRKPPIEKLAQDKVCAELQVLHFIEPAPSAPHAANAVVALKKGPDGQYTANRVCYNYKAINLLTKDMHTGYPVAEELFQDLGDAQWFTRVDLRSGFYQVHLAEASQDFSAFWWDKQLYRFKRVPFGLKHAPAYFQKVMETELGKRGLLKFCKVFIDDILIHSATFAEHIRHVEAVLQCLIEVGLRIHPDKSCFALDAVDFLGFDVSNHGLTPQQAKVQAIKDLPYPANLKDLKTVLGAIARWACMMQSFDFDSMHRPGAQHGNADALSRFPTPRQEDNTGARIDLDADLYAAFPAVPYITYKPLTLTLGCTVDAVLQVREVLSICTKPLTSAVAKMVQSGVTLYEMCGGLCAGLEATLRNGIRVNRYLYSDTAPAAQTVARFRTQALLKLYPHLLQPYACDGAFTTLPQDVKAITPQHLMDAAVNDQTQWLIITGPECQDFSPAGSNRGLRRPRAAVLQACTTVIGYVQQLQHPAQPLYIIENAAMQHNFRSPAIATEDFTAVNMTIGQPICVDAATFNSGALRLRNKWQNLVDPFELQRELNTVRRTANISANAFLDPGRSTTRVYRSDAPPFCLANKIGQPRTALPTLVAYPLSRAFLPDKPGSIYSLQGGAWSEPRPDERERMLGYYTGATAAPGLTALQRHVLTGNCMDQRALVAIIRTSVELAAPPRLTALLAYQPPIRPQLLPASTPVLFLTTVPRFPHSSPAPSDDMPSHSRQFYGTELACMLAVTRNASAPRRIQPAFPPPSAPPATPLIPTLAPGKQLDADIRLADMAKESEPLDIHDDQFVLEYLRRKVLGTNWSVARTR